MLRAAEAMFPLKVGYPPALMHTYNEQMRVCRGLHVLAAGKIIEPGARLVLVEQLHQLASSQLQRQRSGSPPTWVTSLAQLSHQRCTMRRISLSWPRSLHKWRLHRQRTGLMKRNGRPGVRLEIQAGGLGQQHLPGEAGHLPPGSTRDGPKPELGAAPQRQARQVQRHRSRRRLQCIVTHVSS